MNVQRIKIQYTTKYKTYVFYKCCNHLLIPRLNDIDSVTILNLQQ